jgi:hypothetical protein
MICNGAAANAHGMDGTLVAPDWAPLTMEEVRELLIQFPRCGEPLEILSVSPRPFSAASVVATANGRVFIKRHHRSVRDREGLLEEHRFLKHLHAHGAHVPRVFVANDSGETAIESGEWTYEVHEAPLRAWIFMGMRFRGRRFKLLLMRAPRDRRWRNCIAQRRDLTRRAASLGRCSQLHHLCRGRSRRGVGRYLAARPALALDPASRTRGRSNGIARAVSCELLPLLPALAPLWTHNDLHASNLLWSDMGKNARAAGRSSISALPIGPTPYTIWPTRSSATSWSG